MIGFFDLIVNPPPLFPRRRKEVTTFEEWCVEVLRRLELSVWFRLLLIRFLDCQAVYQLKDKRVIGVLTSHYDLSAPPSVMLYKVKMVDQKTVALDKMPL